MSIVVDLIPAAERKEILEKNIIQKAVAISTSQEMKHLMVIWRTYVEPTLESNCNLCYERILKNFKELQPQLIKLQQESNLLESI